MPELIAETVLVVERFKHGDMEYERGDRLALAHRWVRKVVRSNPSWFKQEYAPENVDLAWLDSIEADSEERYKAVLRAREEEEKRRKHALRHELETQDTPQPELEPRYEKQERDRKKREEQAREEREREKVEQ